MNQEARALELILQYNLNEIEAKAMKVALMYLEKAQKLFPDYSHYRLPKGNPCKSELFRYCHKLIRETQGKIQDSDYKFYVHAQLDILRNIKKGDIHPLVTPACLAGKKAWKRWLLWKSKYDKMLERKMSSANASTIDVHNEQKVKKDLWKTKQFFLAWFDRLDVQDIKEVLKDKNIFLWYHTGSVCGYYFLLSKVVTDWLQKNPIDLKKEFGIDLYLYKEAIKPEIVSYFNSEFSYEV